MIFYDFEVFEKDWLAVFIDVTKKKEHVIINSPDKLKALYEANRKDIWVRHDEEVLGFTLDNKKNLDEFIGDTPSCVCWNDKKAIRSILTGEFGTEDIYTENWNYPVGAFHGADGGSC